MAGGSLVWDEVEDVCGLTCGVRGIFWNPTARLKYMLALTTAVALALITC